MQKEFSRWFEEIFFLALYRGQLLMGWQNEFLVYGYVKKLILTV